jgi:hypothetical protein
MVSPNVGLQVTIILTEAEAKIVRWIAESSNKLPEDIVYQFYRKGLSDTTKELNEILSGPYSGPGKTPPTYPPGARDIPPHIKQQLDYEDSLLKDAREKNALNNLADLRKNCRHERTERFEDDAMYRCLSCGATGIVGSGRDPV